MSTADRSVLVVDDQADVRFLAQAILRTSGFRVVEAPDGESALLLLADDSFRPAVVLLDVNMPGINGWDVLGILHREPGCRSELPVIIFTAHCESIEDAPVVFQDHEYFLPKPFSPDELVSLVQKAIDAA